ncbi:MAG: CpXC domain-containing protein [Planctomycetota bacterium]|nr:CpXC domain-containing protein [Planctomycetota bacterium]
MSVSSKETIACRYCGHEQEFTLWQSINATLDPQLREQLMSGELMTFTCQSCQKSAEVVWPLLYHDMEREVMVHIRFDESLSEGQAPEADPVEDFMLSFTLRTVASRNELVEKVLIFEEGLDDRVIEIFKIALRRQLEQDAQEADGELMFSACGESEEGEKEIAFVLLKGEGESSFAVPLSVYEYFAENIRARLPDPEEEAGKWLRVDGGYAMAVI